MSFTLINAGPSPFGRKVAIALIEKGLKYDVKYDLPWSDSTCTPQYSPVQQLPILIEENGNCIYDSHYILEWLERRYPEPPLVPSGVDAALEAKLRQLLGERLIEFMATLIFEISRPAPSAPWVERQEKKLRGALQELDRLVANRVISDTRPIDVGDIAIGTALLGMEAGVAMGHCPNDERFNWRAGYPALARYMAVLEARPSFVATPFREMEIDKTAVVG